MGALMEPEAFSWHRAVELARACWMRSGRTQSGTDGEVKSEMGADTQLLGPHPPSICACAMRATPPAVTGAVAAS